MFWGGGTAAIHLGKFCAGPLKGKLGKSKGIGKILKIQQSTFFCNIFIFPMNCLKVLQLQNGRPTVEENNLICLGVLLWGRCCSACASVGDCNKNKNRCFSWWLQTRFHLVFLWLQWSSPPLPSRLRSHICIYIYIYSLPFVLCVAPSVGHWSHWLLRSTCFRPPNTSTNCKKTHKV